MWPYQRDKMAAAKADESQPGFNNEEAAAA